MRFISPKTDYAFKKIFGSDQSQDILISFLNAIIYKGKNKIKSLTILNPYNPRQVQTLKDSYLDVRAVLNNNSQVIIEMQVANVTAFDKRVVYNLAKTYSTQLGNHQPYMNLKPVIAVTITDFKMFNKTSDVVNHFAFLHEKKAFKYTAAEMKLVFVELPKFNKPLEQLETLVDKWIYFIKEAESLELIPESLGEVSAIEKALNIANEINLTPEELQLLEQRAMKEQDESGRVLLEAKKAGKKGEKKGEKKGRKKGRIEEAFALIMRLLKKRFGEVPENLKNQLSDLSLEELENLSEEIFDFTTFDDLSNWLANR
ncbi:MAG: Rpn family recombination-promoting nuclease/putative transposase [Okeania sp. SIO3B5]|uniref:Rpn family recombination-promoting nuclease/putative transposase n=1 Tax=Okeania sp. SIO3B5 TaxID=2607811 RepID=UPI0013FEAE55|nr:Rpn family recombination-promoting nuclease/putative transposase [Okeania sp. SIO3B5]NEO53200.1 Rpn family recombination-promoting nuclease/putative transposase [Okeania sp. SIO3B5]